MPWRGVHYDKILRRIVSFITRYILIIAGSQKEVNSVVVQYNTYLNILKKQPLPRDLMFVYPHTFYRYDLIKSFVKN